MIAADFIKQVSMMPPRKILMQSLAYSIYSGVLLFPNNPITASGMSSKIRNDIVPTASISLVITAIVSLTRSIFPEPRLNPIIGCPPRLIPITTDTTIPNTFITIPTTANGVTAPYAIPVLA